MSALAEHASKVGRGVPNAPWPVVRLGDVAKTSSGGTPKRTAPAYYGGGIPWVKSGELGDSTVYETSETISKAGLDGSSAKIFPKGTLCVALYGATVGKLGILGVDAATNQAVCGIFLPPEIGTRFAYRFLESKRRQLVESAKGGAQPNISQEIIRDLQFPMPPIDDQRRVVAEIEKQFTRLEAGIAALRRTQANLKRYRAVVLKTAFEGCLTSKEKNRTVFPSANWPVVRLGSVAKTSSGGTPKRGVAAFYNGEIPWVKSGELGDGTVYNISEKISQAGLARSSAKLFPKGTLCVALYGATVGKLGILGVDAATNQAVCGIFLPPEINTRFAFRFLESKRRQLVESAKGGAQPNISQEIIRDLQFPLPSLDEQLQTVREVERRLSVVEELETVVNANLQRATRLRQSILQRAFLR